MTVSGEKTTKTTCPYCGVGCGVVASQRPDGTVGIKGDPTHPANFGRLCSKGSALGETVDLEGRLLHPEIQGRRASWDESLDEIALRFSNTIKEHGPDSVAFYVSGQILTEDYYVANKLMKGFIGSANIDTNSRLCMASSVVGHIKAFGTDTVPGTYEDLELADTIILVGSNLIWCHPVLYQRIAAAKAKRPEMKVVLVDPRRTMTADLADLYLPLKPDSDTPLFMGLFHELVKNGDLDRDYIEHHTNGFEVLEDAAGEFSIDRVAQQTGLSHTDIRSFYALWRRSLRVVTCYSQGVNQSEVGTDKVSAILNCHLATGRIGKPGTGPFSLTGQPNAMGGREVGGLATMLASHMSLQNPAHRKTLKDFWNAPKIADTVGLKAVELFDAVAKGEVKALWIMATNPVDSLPNADLVERAIKACPFVVVSDVLKDTDTVRHAQIKLPSLAWGEKDGTVTNSERRISRQRAFLPAPGEARADWWQFSEVGKRMGFEDAFSFKNSAEIFREYSELSSLKETGPRDLDLTALTTLSAEQYDALEPVQWPVTSSAMSGDKRFFAKGGFYTPDRRANFVVPGEITQSNTPKFPIVMNTGRVRDHWHTMTRTGKSSRLSAHLAEPYVEIHPRDAARSGIGDADIVGLNNQFGSIDVRALVTDRVAEGAVFVPMHWTEQFASNPRVGKLVAPKRDPYSGQPASKNVPVALSRIAMGYYGFMLCQARPNVEGLDYWAVAKTSRGWRLEFALKSLRNSATKLFAQIASAPEQSAQMSVCDEKSGLHKFASYSSTGLDAVLFLDRKPVSASRSLLAEEFASSTMDAHRVMRLLAGRTGQGQVDKGAIICSCMSVGVNEIGAAVKRGCRTVEEIGAATKAGTNCGSCRAEIREILNVDHSIAAE